MLDVLYGAHKLGGALNRPALDVLYGRDRQARARGALWRAPRRALRPYSTGPHSTRSTAILGGLVLDALYGVLYRALYGRARPRPPVCRRGSLDMLSSETLPRVAMLYVLAVRALGSRLSIIVLGTFLPGALFQEVSIIALRRSRSRRSAASS